MPSPFPRARAAALLALAAIAPSPALPQVAPPATAEARARLVEDLVAANRILVDQVSGALTVIHPAAS